MRSALVLLTFAASCDRRHHEEPAPLPPQPACTLAAIPTRLPAAKRVVAIGDLHGDLGGARAALRAAGAIGTDDHWIGGDLVIVQTGDVLDRGDDESAILELLAHLDGEARAAGGALVQLLGNHELMNAAGDFRYVTPGGKRDFGGDRVHALGPGGAWAKRLAQHNVVAIIDDTVLSHAGVLPAWADRIDDINLMSRCWLDGEAGTEPAADTAQDGPVWTRDYGGDEVDCAQLDAVLAKLGVHRMVVGHTVQAHGITSACDGKLWRIDVGLAKVYDGPIEVLELAPDPRVLHGTR